MISTSLTRYRHRPQLCRALTEVLIPADVRVLGWPEARQEMETSAVSGKPPYIFLSREVGAGHPLRHRHNPLKGQGPASVEAADNLEDWFQLLSAVFVSTCYG